MNEKQVCIKHNPYSLITEIRVDGINPANQSELHNLEIKKARMFYWIDDMFEILADEYNQTEFTFEFHGIEEDYAHLCAAVEKAAEAGIIDSTVPAFVRGNYPEIDEIAEALHLMHIQSDVFSASEEVRDLLASCDEQLQTAKESNEKLQAISLAVRRLSEMLKRADLQHGLDACTKAAEKKRKRQKTLDNALALSIAFDQKKANVLVKQILSHYELFSDDFSEKAQTLSDNLQNEILKTAVYLTNRYGKRKLSFTARQDACQTVIEKLLAQEEQWRRAVLKEIYSVCTEKTLWKRYKSFCSRIRNSIKSDVNSDAGINLIDFNDFCKRLERVRKPEVKRVNFLEIADGETYDRIAEIPEYYKSLSGKLTEQLSAAIQMANEYFKELDDTFAAIVNEQCDILMAHINDENTEMIARQRTEKAAADEELKETEESIRTCHNLLKVYDMIVSLGKGV